VSAVVPARAGIQSITWHLVRFEDLSPKDLHDALQLRSAVFVVEQNCVFLDVDGADPPCWHLLGRGADGALVAYARLVPPGVKYPEPSIGRVVSSNAARRTGAGRELMRESVRHAEALWPGHSLKIGAQMYLKAFYESFGFVQASDPYDEDGILHIEMVREARK
jgi:ElaA protein